MKYLRFSHGALNRSRSFSFLLKIFLTFRFLKVELSSVPTLRPDQFGTIFIFMSKIFFSISRFSKVDRSV